MEKGTMKELIDRPFVRSNIRLLEANLTSRQVDMIRGRWVGRMAGRLVIGRQGRLSVIVGRMAGRLVTGRVGRFSVLVRRMAGRLVICEFSVLVARIPQ